MTRWSCSGSRVSQAHGSAITVSDDVDRVSVESVCKWALGKSVRANPDLQVRTHGCVTVPNTRIYVQKCNLFVCGCTYICICVTESLSMYRRAACSMNIS